MRKQKHGKKRSGSQSPLKSQNDKRPSLITIFETLGISGLLIIGYMLQMSPSHKIAATWVFFTAWVLVGLFVALRLTSEYLERTEPEPPSEGPAQSLPQKPRFSEKVDWFTVVIGGNTSKWPITDDKTHAILHLNRDLVTSRVIDGELRIDAILKGPTGDVELRDNELRNRPPNWDKNWDNSAIEIVNAKGVPVFQLEYLDGGHTARVNGHFSGGHALQAYATESGLAINPAHKVRLKPIFRYPSSKYFGKRR